MNQLFRIFFLVLLASLAISCLDGGSKKNKNPVLVNDVSIPFMVHSGTAHLSCGTSMSNLGTMNNSGSMKDVRLFIHDMVLMDENGESYPLVLNQNEWQNENVGLLSFSNKSNCPENQGDIMATNTAITGQYAAPKKATITGIKFKVGVPEALNHRDVTQAPSPLNISNMNWSWNMGYKHMLVETTIEPDLDFIFHLGSVGCNGDAKSGEIVSCLRANRPEIMIHHFDLSMSAVEIDLQALMMGMDLSSGGSCHSFAGKDVCAAAFDALGLDYYDGNDDTANTLPQEQSGQTVFKSAMSHGG